MCVCVFMCVRAFADALSIYPLDLNVILLIVLNLFVIFKLPD